MGNGTNLKEKQRGFEKNSCDVWRRNKKMGQYFQEIFEMTYLFFLKSSAEPLRNIGEHF